MARREVWTAGIDNYILYASISNIPFTYSELMKLPTKVINHIYKSVEKEHERKSKQAKEL